MHVVRVIARLNVGGPSRHVAFLSSDLEQHGISTTLVTGMVPAGEADMGWVAEELGVNVLQIPSMSRAISLRDLSVILRLWRILRRERPEILHTHTSKAGTVGRAAFLLWKLTGARSRSGRRPRAVHTFHGHVFHGYYGHWTSKLFVTIERILARLLTDALIVISQEQRREIVEVFGVGTNARTHVIPLGFDIEHFAAARNRRDEARKSFDLEPDVTAVAIVGRLTAIKNHRLFFEALKKAALGNDLAVLVAGDGELRESLESHVAELGLRNVRFLGNVRHVERVYAAADFLALTSNNEGTPLTLLEGMAAGLTSITTAVGGVADIIGLDSAPPRGACSVATRALAAPAGDPDGVAQGIVMLASDRDLRERLGRAGREYVSKRYGRGRLAHDIAALYNRLSTT